MRGSDGNDTLVVCGPGLNEEVPPFGEKRMISFIAKTWWLWWMLATVVAVRWFHLLSEANQMEPAETLAPEDEEDIVSWQLRRNGRVISMFEREHAS